MSSSQAGTQYAISAFQGNQAASVNIEITANASDTFGDTDAFALFNALVAAFPEAWGVAAGAGISKTQESQTTWNGDTTADPQVFQ